MAIDISQQDHRQRLGKALRKSYTDKAPTRRTRRNLYDIYRDKVNPAFELTNTQSEDLGTLVNLFQKFVRGHLLTLAFYNPKWDINARTDEGRGFDREIESFLTRYAEILGFNKIQRQLALDSAFGWAVAKVDNGIAPKGITAPVAPRVYRIDPDMLIVDPTAATVDECSWIGDFYLVPLNEAQVHEGFEPDVASKLTEFRNTTGASSITLPEGSSETEAYAEPMTRLVDVYIAKAGGVYTWAAPNDEFEAVKAGDVLGFRKTSVNPYCLLDLTMMPGNLYEISRLKSLRGLHLLTNEMLHKGVDQARASQRNPFGPMGSEADMSAALEAGDNNPFFVESKDNLGLYQIPGPDQSILGLAASAAQMFSSEAGNLEVALGASAGADTARQTEALLGQISASQSLDRRAFEEFLADIAKKLSTLAFESETLELVSRARVKGTKLSFNRLWAPPIEMPRAAAIDDFNFDVVAFSTAFRSPEERLSQLNQASQLIMQWMTVKQQGAPIAIEAVMDSVGRAFDLVPELAEWWNGQEPTPAEKTSQTYQSLAQPPQGSDIRYQGSEQEASDIQGQQQDQAQEGGVA